MLSLSQPLVDTIRIGDKEYRLDLWYDTVLRFFDLMNDDEFTDEERIDVAFDMLVDTGGDTYHLTVKAQAVQAIVENYIIDRDEGSGGGGGSSKQAYCLKQDAPYIYSSFLQEYGVDLVDEQGKLHWFKFTALMSGLRDETKFKEIIGIRLAKIPTGKGSQDEAKRLRELKKIYALHQSHEDKEAEMNAMFNQYLAGGKIK